MEWNLPEQYSERVTPWFHQACSFFSEQSVHAVLDLCFLPAFDLSYRTQLPITPESLIETCASILRKQPHSVVMHEDLYGASVLLSQHCSVYVHEPDAARAERLQHLVRLYGNIEQHKMIRSLTEAPHNIDFFFFSTHGYLFKAEMQRALESLPCTPQRYVMDAYHNIAVLLAELTKSEDTCLLNLQTLLFHPSFVFDTSSCLYFTDNIFSLLEHSIFNHTCPTLYDFFHMNTYAQAPSISGFYPLSSTPNLTRYAFIPEPTQHLFYQAFCSSMHTHFNSFTRIGRIASTVKHFMQVSL